MELSHYNIMLGNAHQYKPAHEDKCISATKESSTFYHYKVQLPNRNYCNLITKKVKFCIILKRIIYNFDLNVS